MNERGWLIHSKYHSSLTGPRLPFAEKYQVTLFHKGKLSGLVSEVTTLAAYGAPGSSAYQAGSALWNHHGAQCAAAIIEPAAPLSRHIIGMIRMFRGGLLPQVPVERRRHRWCVGSTVSALRVPKGAGTVRPHVDLIDRANRPRIDPGFGQPQPFAAVTVVSHLRHDLHVGRRHSHAHRNLMSPFEAQLES